MSQETALWLNTNTLIGFTEKRGNAWHYQEELQGEESNHYPGAIPVPEVVRRLFNFKVVEAPVYYRVSCDFDDPEALGNPVDGYYKFVASQAGRKGMLADDNNYDLGAFKDGYRGHDYKEWLLDNLANLLDDSEMGLGIGSAGLLRERGQAWVSIELPENYKAPGDVEFRSQLTCWTSFDGSLATGYGRHFNIVVCDNTRNMAHADAAKSGQIVRVKHSKNSGMKLNDARDALQIVTTMNEEFASEIEHLLDWKITDKDFEKLLDGVVPAVEAGDSKGSKRSSTMRTKKREEIITLYRSDERCSPWRDTAFGALQAFNTWNHHFASVRGGKPIQIRNQENAIMGRTAQEDNKVLTVLSEVTEHALIAA